MAAASDDAMQAARAAQQPLMDKYGTAVDRESAFEVIQGQAEAAAAEQERAAEGAAAQEAAEKEAAAAAKAAEKEAERAAKEAAKMEQWQEKERQKVQNQVIKDVSRAATSMLGQFGKEAGKQLLRGLFGGLKK